MPEASLFFADSFAGGSFRNGEPASRAPPRLLARHAWPRGRVGDVCPPGPPAAEASFPSPAGSHPSTADPARRIRPSRAAHCRPPSASTESSVSPRLLIPRSSDALPDVSHVSPSRGLSPAPHGVNTGPRLSRALLGGGRLIENLPRTLPDARIHLARPTQNPLPRALSTTEDRKEEGPSPR